MDAIGGNCGNGPEEIVPVIEQMHAAAPAVTLVAKSNAGMPQLIDMRAVYVTDAPTMADWATKMHEAGARIVGACCGSTAEHLAAMGIALGREGRGLRPAPGPSRARPSERVGERRRRDREHEDPFARERLATPTSLPRPAAAFHEVLAERLDRHPSAGLGLRPQVGLPPG